MPTQSKKKRALTQTQTQRQQREIKANHIRAHSSHPIAASQLRICPPIYFCVTARLTNSLEFSLATQYDAAHY